MAKRWFKENGIEFQELDVASDSIARDDMFKISGQMGVPVIDVDGKILVGFQKDKLNRVIEAAILKKDGPIV